MAAARRALLDVGEIVRPHGIKGAVVVRLDTDQLERVAVGTVRSSDVGPLTVTASRPLKDRFVVMFEGVSDPEGAEGLRGVVLRAEPLERPGVIWIDELFGAEVRTGDGVILGHVETVEANPASDLLVLDTGVLVPLRFVVGELADGVLFVEIPEGLTEVQEARVEGSHGPDEEMDADVADEDGSAE
jgi:16S rRNA processing protein RimM